ncbi:MAG: tyrosine--tRNA ligase [Candidatus Hydrothermarchaeaceae archaeon]
MDRFELVKGIGQEIILEDELKQLLEEKKHPVAYDGFEPSGLAHLPVGIYRPLLIKDLLKAGVKVKLILADSFAWINNKFDGDLERIRAAGEYFMEVWKAAGVDMSKVDVIWHKEFFDDPEYWKKVILVAKSHSLTRTKRSMAIAGRSADDSQQAGLAFYPSMQCADIFHIGADICQLGLDQRKVNMLAREVADREGMVAKLEYEGKGINGKPVIVSHRMLMALTGPVKAKGFDDDSSVDVAISSKMSKSIPETSIFVHDSEEEIKRKINAAFCPMEEVTRNPVLEYAKEIIFRSFDGLEIKRPDKFGGDVTFYGYPEVEKAYASGDLHPQDLKIAVAERIDQVISPVRRHFEKDNKAGKLYETIASYNTVK